MRNVLILLFFFLITIPVFALQPTPIYSNDGCLIQLDTIQKTLTKGRCTKSYSVKFDAAIWLTAFAVQADNKVVVALVNNKIDFVIQNGRPVRIVNSPIRLLRLNPNLTVDNSFGTNGYVFVSNIPNVTALTVQENGNIVAAGGNMQLAIFSSSGKLNLYHKLNADGIIVSTS